MLWAWFAPYLAFFHNPFVLSSRGGDQWCHRTGPPTACKRFDYILLLHFRLAVRFVGVHSPSPADEEEYESGDDRHTEDTARYRCRDGPARHAWGLNYDGGIATRTARNSDLVSPWI